MTEWLNKQQMIQSFNAAAQTYDQAADLQRDVGDLLLHDIHKQDLNHKTILDIGSGTGYLSQCIQEHPIISMDIAENMLKFSQQHRPTQNYICSDAERLCFSDNSIDIIISNMALHWCQDLKKTLRELHRILKSDGRLIFTVLGENSLWELQHCWNTIDKHTHVNPFPNKNEIRNALTDKFSKTTVITNTLTRYHKSIYTFMKKLKAIGAHNVTVEKPKGLTGRKKLQALEKAYESFRNKENYLPATYEVIIGHCTK